MIRCGALALFFERRTGEIAVLRGNIAHLGAALATAGKLWVFAGHANQDDDGSYRFHHPRVRYYGYDRPRDVHVYRHHVRNVFVDADPHYYPHSYRYRSHDRACHYSSSRWRCQY